MPQLVAGIILISRSAICLHLSYVTVSSSVTWQHKYSHCRLIRCPMTWHPAVGLCFRNNHCLDTLPCQPPNCSWQLSPAGTADKVCDRVHPMYQIGATCDSYTAISNIVAIMGKLLEWYLAPVCVPWDRATYSPCRPCHNATSECD